MVGLLSTRWLVRLAKRDSNRLTRLTASRNDLGAIVAAWHFGGEARGWTSSAFCGRSRKRVLALMLLQRE